MRQPRPRPIHVYCGPTLAPADLSSENDNPARLCIHAPIAHGDLLEGHVADRDVAVIIDGVFHQGLAARHKEFLEAMSRGILLVGAASIGALRAAELRTFGMLGVGDIFRSYTDGTTDNDADVAVAHTDSSDGFERLTIPLVDVRSFADRLPHEIATRLLVVARSIYYADRTTESLASGLVDAGLDELTAEGLSQRVDSFARSAQSAKRRDAVEAIHVARDLAQREPNSQASQIETRPWYETSFVERWRNDLLMASEPHIRARIQFQRLFNIEFEHTWFSYLDYRSRSEPTSPMTLRNRFRLQMGKDPAQSDALAKFAPLLFIPQVQDWDRVGVGILLSKETSREREIAERRWDIYTETLRRHPKYRALEFSREFAESKLPRGMGATSPKWRLRGFRSAGAVLTALAPFAAAERWERAINERRG